MCFGRVEEMLDLSAAALRVNENKLHGECAASAAFNSIKASNKDKRQMTEKFGNIVAEVCGKDTAEIAVQGKGEEEQRNSFDRFAADHGVFASSSSSDFPPPPGDWGGKEKTGGDVRCTKLYSQFDWKAFLMPAYIEPPVDKVRLLSCRSFPFELQEDADELRRGGKVPGVAMWANPTMPEGHEGAPAVPGVVHH